MIPRKLHRVWLGDAEVPADHAAFWQKWQELHPEWECTTWGADSVENHKLFGELQSMSAKSDLLRYEILRREGGVYVDTDFEPLRPLDPLLEMGLRAFAAWEDENRVCTALLASEPGHPAVEALVRGLPAWSRKHRGQRPDIQTGPVFLTNTWRGRPDVTLLPTVSFYPVGYWQRDTLPCDSYPEAAFAVHHWGRSWMSAADRAKDDASIPQRVAFLVPRKADGGHRDEVWAWLKPRWQRNFPQAQIVEGESDPFNRARSINTAAAAADADVYVIVDADSWCSPDAVRAATESGATHSLPWSKGYKLTQRGTAQLLALDPHEARLTTRFVLAHLDEPEHHHLSGVVVVTRAAFETVGGFDERFEGWGFEDTAFIYALEDTFGAAGRRGPANLVHLWHPAAADSGDPSDESVALFNEYRAQRGLTPWQRGVDR